MGQSQSPTHIKGKESWIAHFVGSGIKVLEKQAEIENTAVAILGNDNLLLGPSPTIRSPAPCGAGFTLFIGLGKGYLTFSRLWATL